uniref:Uncharacterized protein n=1 Tax=Arundo donax TaxID=35708 RepID=A0A0A9EQG8_ARUDO
MEEGMTQQGRGAAAAVLAPSSLWMEEGTVQRRQERRR